jgi:uncharacterized protein
MNFSLLLLRKILIVILLVICVSSCRSSDFKKVCLKGVCVDAEVADTDQQRSRGLMYRGGLGKNKAMLFIFDTPSIYSFWMKNMRFSLDIIWIGSDKRIAAVKTDFPPCKTEVCEAFTPSVPAQFVLEVPAGFVKKHGISIKDPVTIR